MNFISSMLSTEGTVSSSRAVLLLTVAFVLAKLGAFNVAALVHGQPPVPFDPTDVAILATAFSGKVLNSVFAENKGVTK